MHSLTRYILAPTLGLAICLQAMAESSPATTLDALHAAGRAGNVDEFAGQLQDDATLISRGIAYPPAGDSLSRFLHSLVTDDTAWAFTSRDRHISYSRQGDVAWFTEILNHASEGDGYGSGILTRERDRWLIVQYHLDLPLRPGSGATTATELDDTSSNAETQAVDGEKKQEKKRCRKKRHKTNSRADC